jgi:hypothetical protein
MIIEYVDHDFPLQDPPKFTQIWIFGLKPNYLATLAGIARYIRLTSNYGSQLYFVPHSRYALGIDFLRTMRQ